MKFKLIMGVVALLALAPVAARADELPFAHPPIAVKPKTRWWWGDTLPLVPGELASEVDGFAAAGFGGAEAAFGGALGGDTPAWGSAEQRAGLVAALQAAQANGMRLDMTIGASWPITTPNTKPGSGLSEQELMYGRRDLTGPSTYTGPPPNALDDPSGQQKGGRLVAVTAAQVTDEGDPVVQAGTPPHKTTTLDPKSLQVLKVDDGGMVHFDVPSGHWIVFGLWQRDAGEGVMDHLSTESLQAVTKYIDDNQLGADAAALLPAAGGQFFEDSLELDANELFWTNRMFSEFRARRGYDVTKYLPLLFVEGKDHYWVPDKMPPPDFDLPAEAGSRARHDFDRTLTDLYIDKHMAGFVAWARTHGMRYRTQPAFGDAFDVTRSAREVDRMGGLADDESLNAGDIYPFDSSNDNWRFAMDHYRSVAGGAHQAGQTEVASELGAVFLRARMMGLADYKALMDKQWAFGLTRPILHGFAYQLPDAAWPGTDHFAGLVADSWNAKTYPQQAMWPALTDYWSRGALVLQQGRARTDVAVYRDGFVTTAATTVGIGNGALINQGGEAGAAVQPGEKVADPRPTPFFDGAPLERAGYTYEYLDPVGAAEAQARGDGVLYPDGPRYRALVLDERALPGATADAIAGAAERGLAVVVVGGLPDRGTSLDDAGAEDRQVKAAVDRLLAAPRVRRVKDQGDVLGALRALGVEPAARWSKSADVYSQWRHTADSDYVYLWNSTDRPVSFTGSFAATGRPEVLDLWTGAIAPAGVYRENGDRIELPVELGPGGTMMLAFRRDGGDEVHLVSSDAEDAVGGDGIVELRDTRGGERHVALNDGSSRTVSLGDLPKPVAPAKWHLHVDGAGPNGTTPYDVDLDALQDWRDISGLSGVSGTGTYTTTVTLPESWTAGDRGTYLDLGAVAGAVRAYVNGRLAGADVVAGRRLDVSGLLHGGANALKVVVTTTLKNKIVAECQSGNAALALMCAQPATQAYGLLGPVSLVPFARATIALPRLRSLSGTRACTSRRRFDVHLRAPRRFRVRGAVLRLNGRARPAKVRRRGRRLAVVVDLRGMAKRRAVVRITVRGQGRRAVRTARAYRPCVKR